MSEEIKAWDEAWAEEFGNTNEGRKASAEFKEILRGIERSEGGKAAFEFLLAGGHLGFSKDMWGSEEGDITRIWLIRSRSNLYHHQG